MSCVCGIWLQLYTYPVQYIGWFYNLLTAFCCYKHVSCRLQYQQIFLLFGWSLRAGGQACGNAVMVSQANLHFLQPPYLPPLPSPPDGAGGRIGRAWVLDVGDIGLEPTFKLNQWIIKLIIVTSKPGARHC